MNYIECDKDKLANLTYSKSKEIIRSSRTGSFASSTIIGLNTRKYHGLFIVPQDKIDKERHVLVSNLNEAIIIDNMEFHIGINQYKGNIIDPKGNKYLQQFVPYPIPTYQYRVGKFNFKKEILFLGDSDRVIIKYTILDAFESASIQFQPLLAFRQIHALTHENNAVNTNFNSIEQGVEYCLYPNYTPVCFQASDKIYYEHGPVWYKNIEYEQEINRGYEGHED